MNYSTTFIIYFNRYAIGSVYVIFNKDTHEVIHLIKSYKSLEIPKRQY